MAITMILDTVAKDLWFIGTEDFTGNSGNSNWGVYPTGANITITEPLPISDTDGGSDVTSFKIWVGPSDVQVIVYHGPSVTDVKGRGWENRVSYTSLTGAQQTVLEGKTSLAVSGNANNNPLAALTVITYTAYTHPVSDTDYKIMGASTGPTHASWSDITLYDNYLNSEVLSNGTDALRALDITWKIVGSTATVDAVDHLGVFSTPVYSVLNTKIVDDSTDLWDNTLDNAVTHEFDGTTGTLDVYTGTDPSDGTGTAGLELGETNVTYGLTDSATSTWANSSNKGRAVGGRLYGISTTIRHVSVGASFSTEATALYIDDGLDFGGTVITLPDPTTPFSKLGNISIMDTTNNNTIGSNIGDGAALRKL